MSTAKEIQEIQNKLLEMADPGYKTFQGGLIPTQDGTLMIGVRTPALRSFAKELAKLPCKDIFLCSLPHTYFEENQLHAFLIAGEKDYDKCLEMLKNFLPYVDNWATCDQMNAKVLKRNLSRTREFAYACMESSHTYTVRFGIKILMDYFLDEAFEPEYLEKVASVASEEYYIKMMAAWYFATALAKQYDATILYIENHRLEKWTHNKAIQKAVESYRVTEEHKQYLRTLKEK